ncbi:hypothetical protein A2783_02175 [Microgenomates group bacterium RIFCSPHIGHO2_01_FULL_45_11]|nr:MAG: hypothetical protein A2783_02175 [Microgenomates group bacterium RIFCSPHIGHO2_01_FULL_45_11]
MKMVGGLIILVVTFWLASIPVFAQRQPTPTPSPAPTTETATHSATATPSAVVEKVIVVEKPDITEPTVETKGRLERYLDEQRLGPLNYTNFLRYSIRQAVSRGVPANTIVLILLFPVVAAIIAASRHLLGIRGFGIFTPAVLSVAFVATGLVSGILLFLVILLVADLGQRLLKRLKLQYLPRMALLLWFVSLGVFAVIFLTSLVNFGTITNLNIFPILIMVLIAETVIEVRIGKSPKEAADLTIETIILAVVSGLILSLDLVQKSALLNPEILVLSVAIFDIFVGKFVGLRLLEYLKYRKLLK